MHPFVSFLTLLVKEQVFSHHKEKQSQCNSVIVAFLTRKIRRQFPALNVKSLANIAVSLGASGSPSAELSCTSQSYQSNHLNDFPKAV
jgi:hypothetical protein